MTQNFFRKRDTYCSYAEGPFFRPDRTLGINGFSLVELLTVIAIVAALAAIALPAYNNYINKTKCRRAMSEIRTLNTEISGYALDKGVFPNTLADINRGGYLDPWQRPYVYNNFSIPGDPPLEDPYDTLNIDYDLYSLGKDGVTEFTDGDPKNLDDVVRFNNGAYIGMRVPQ